MRFPSRKSPVFVVGGGDVVVVVVVCDLFDSGMSHESGRAEYVRSTLP